MSSSESSCSDDEPFNTSRLRKILTDLHNDLTESIHTVKSLRKKSKAMRESLIVRELTKEAQEIFDMTEASAKDIVNFWLPLWKEEGRVSESGRLGEEAAILGLKPEKKVDIYDLYDLLDCLFV